MEQLGLGIREVLEKEIARRSTRFVFPSEICAEAWLAASLDVQGAAGAVEADRFLGWDRFKELAAGLDGRIAIDDALRRVCAAQILEENARSPFMESVLPKPFAKEWEGFASYLAAKLPALGSLPQALARLTREGKTPGQDPRLQDWIAIRDRYAAFLEKTGRFEASFEAIRLRELPGQTILFFPELIEDFEQYSPSLASCSSVRLVPLPVEEAKICLRHPETALRELRSTLSEIGALLDSGTPAADIALTLAGLEGYRPYLEREAQLLSLPIALRSGQPLSRTSGGRLFAALREVHSTDFCFDAMRDLLLCAAWPWKSPERARGIVREGMRLHAIASWKSGEGRQVDVWESVLRGEDRLFYRSLHRDVRAIVQASSFQALLQAYSIFKRDFLSENPEDWEENANLTLARAIVELQNLAAAEAETGLSVSHAFGLFQQKLETTQYVSVKSPSGVSVYDWRVGAGVPAPWHFVLHASQDALTAIYRSFDFLGERLRESLGSERDAAGDFIKAYGLSGKNVIFSCPQTGLEGELAVHGSLVSLADEAAETAMPEAVIDDSYAREAAWLSSRGPRPRRLHRIQLEGLAAAAEAAALVQGEGAFLEADTAIRASRLLCREEDRRLRLDSTAIDHFLACPYEYLYLRLLQAAPEASGIEFIDDFFMGDVYHAALDALFVRIKNEDGRFRPERLSDYRSWLPECLDQAFEKLGAKSGSFVTVVLESYRARLEAYLAFFLGGEAQRFPGCEVVATEERLEMEYPAMGSHGVVLKGRIDRLSRSEAGMLIIDYKKGRLPSKAQVLPTEEGSIAEAQIPCYLRLVEAQGEEIDAAWYLSIEGNSYTEPGKAVCAFGEQDEKGKGAYVGRTQRAGFLAAFDAALGQTAKGIEAGSYPLAAKDRQESVCEGCMARGICRERYALRFGSETRGGRQES